MIPFNFSKFTNQFALQWNSMNDNDREQWSNAMMSVIATDKVVNKNSVTKKLDINNNDAVCKRGACAGSVEIVGGYYSFTTGDPNGCYGSGGTWSVNGGGGLVLFTNRSGSKLALTIRKRDLDYGATQCDITNSRVPECGSYNTFYTKTYDLCYSWKPVAPELELSGETEFVPGCEDICFTVDVSLATALEGTILSTIPPDIKDILISIFASPVSVDVSGPPSGMSGESIITRNVPPLWVPPYGLPESDNGDVWTTTVLVNLNLLTKVVTASFIVSHNNVVNGSNTIFSAGITQNNLDSVSNGEIEKSPNVTGWLPTYSGGSGIDFSDVKMSLNIPWSWGNFFS